MLIPSVECKLVSTPDVRDKAGQPYLSTDRFDVDGEPVYGRGEIVVRGTNISSGYYMMKDKTKEDWEDDGFFHTGDIGQFMTDGSLRIVDRKKNLVKLKGGEYIALEKMEMTYGNCEFVDAVGGGICVYGDGDMVSKTSGPLLCFLRTWTKRKIVCFSPIYMPFQIISRIAPSPLCK